jgi:hypothetical protein
VQLDYGQRRKQLAALVSPSGPIMSGTTVKDAWKDRLKPLYQCADLSSFDSFVTACMDYAHKDAQRVAEVMKGVPAVLHGDAHELASWIGSDVFRSDGSAREPVGQVIRACCTRFDVAAKFATGICNSRSVGGLMEALREYRFRVRQVETSTFPDGILIATRRALSVQDGTPWAQVWILFRGTDRAGDWLVNLKAWGVAPPLWLEIDGKVHAGFLSRYLALRQAIWETVQDLLQAHADETKTNVADLPVSYSICGYSQGAALATLTALEASTRVFRTNSRRKLAVRLYTFANPGVLFNARSFESSCIRQISFIIDTDPLPRAGLWWEMIPTGVENVLRYRPNGTPSYCCDLFRPHSCSLCNDLIQDLVGGDDDYSKVHRTVKMVGRPRTPHDARCPGVWICLAVVVSAAVSLTVGLSLGLKRLSSV